MQTTDRGAVPRTGAGGGRVRLAGRLGPNYRWVIWFAISLAAFFQNFQMFSYSVLVPSLLAELGLSYAVAGTISSAYTLASIVVMAPLGAFGDRLGWRRLFVVGMVLMSVGSFAFAAAQTYAWAVLARVILGTGAAVVMVMPPALLAAWFAKDQYRGVLGLHISLGKTGSILATWLLPTMIVVLGWRLGFAVASLVGPLVFLAAFLVANEPSELGLPSGNTLAVPRAQRAARSELPPRLLEVARNRNLLLLALSQALYFIAYLGTVNWVPTYLKVVTGASEVEGGFQVGFILWGTIAGFALSGYATNWLGRARPLYSAGLLGTAVMTALIAASLLPALPGWLWPPFMFLYGLFLSMMVLVNLLTGSLVPARALGTGIGLVLALSFLGQMVGPPLVGAVADRTGLLTNGFWLAAGCALLGFAISLLIKEGRAPQASG